MKYKTVKWKRRMPKGEMDAHLNSADRSSGNRRNGKMSKTVQIKYGEVTVAPPS